MDVDLTKIAAKYGRTAERFLMGIEYGELLVVPTRSARSGAYFREQISELIEKKRTFVLTYTNPDGSTQDWTVRYAEINIREECEYLDAWCEEETQKLDGSELDAIAHNTCFRFDRMANYRVDDARWRKEGLDTVLAKVAFYGRPAFEMVEKATGAKDIAIRLNVTEDGIVETVAIASVFWFLRSVLKYGGDAEIVEPKSLRVKMKENLKKTLARYK